MKFQPSVLASSVTLANDTNVIVVNEDDEFVMPMTTPAIDLVDPQGDLIENTQGVKHL